jgi:fumarate reductase flavoprotein subunit
MNSTPDINIEDLSTDIVCIGAGGTGLAAAVAAAENGAKVIVIEKLNKAGGNTARAQGFFAAESSTQKRLNINAPKDVLFKMSMEYSHWKVNPRIMRVFIDKSADTVNWLEKQGLPQIKEIWPLFPGQPIPTMHYPDGGGQGLINVLLQSCAKLGVQLLYQTEPQNILTNAKGEVTGLLATSKGKKFKITARGVIIGTGGYAGNKELLKKYCRWYSEDILNPGLPHMGDGIRIATEIGAATEGLGTLQWLGPVFEGYAHGPGIWKDPVMIWVNKKGERFADEVAGYNHFESVNAVLRQPGKVTYSVFDETIKRNIVERIEKGQLKFRGLSNRPPSAPKPDFTQDLYQEAEKGKVKIADSWDDMAGWIGANPEVLKSTINEYNACCDRGRDDVFSKDAKYLLPLLTPPYYAMRCHPIFLTTIGGIKINHRMEVLNREDDTIRGLYAGGNDTGGWEPENCYNAFLSAHAFGFAINSGRIAGENAALYVSQK